MNFQFRTATQAADVTSTQDEIWKTCKTCHCYSHRHQLKVQPLTGIQGDKRLSGMLHCNACGRDCQKVKQNLERPPDVLDSSSRIAALKDFIGQ